MIKRIGKENVKLFFIATVISALINISCDTEIKELSVKDIRSDLIGKSLDFGKNGYWKFESEDEFLDIDITDILRGKLYYSYKIKAKVMNQNNKQKFNSELFVI